MFNTTMEIDDDNRSEANTSIYDDQELDSSEDEINANNWKYLFQDVFTHLPEKRRDDGARPLHFTGPSHIRLKNLPDCSLSFPLSAVICSRLICEYSQPLTLSNRYHFCGTKIVNTAWQINADAIDLPLPFSAAVRTSALEQLRLSSPPLSSQFDLILNKLLVFGPCPHAKIYTFDDRFFIYVATVLVFLPSTCTGGTYRFIDDNEDDEGGGGGGSVHRHVFNQNDSNSDKPFILLLPSDCQHEIEPIERGYKLLLVYHLVTKMNSIDQLYSRLSSSVDLDTLVPHSRLTRLFTYWRTHLQPMGTKLLIPLQHPLDYSPYYSLLFRHRYRQTLEFLQTVLHSFPSFLTYSAVVQQDPSSNTTADSRLHLDHLTLLSSTKKLPLTFPVEHKRVVFPSEFLGELHQYTDAFQHADNPTVVRNSMQYHVLLLIPFEYQWDLLLDDHPYAFHHLSYMLSLPKTHFFFDQSCLNFLECLLRDRGIVSFDPLVRAFVELRERCGLTPKLLRLAKDLLEHPQLKEQFFSDLHLVQSFNSLITAFNAWPMFSSELLIFFRQLLNHSLPMKINEVRHFLLHLDQRDIQALLINTLLRFVFKPRALPRHILLSTLCSLFHLLTIDGSYSVDALLTLAYQIVRRVRKLSSENEILDKGLKSHLIPMLINISRDCRAREKSSRVLCSSPGYVLIYQYCLNTLHYYCSPSFSSSSSLNIISLNEALLICPCDSCHRLQSFLLDSKVSTLIVEHSDHCLRHSLKQFPMLALEYQHDPFTGSEQTLIISKCAYEQEQKQLCFHLRRLLMQFHRL